MIAHEGATLASRGPKPAKSAPTPSRCAICAMRARVLGYFVAVPRCPCTPAGCAESW